MAGKLHGGVGTKGDSKGAGTAAALKGKGKKKAKRGWKGIYTWKGKGKGLGKQSINVASDVEYAAAWNDGEEQYWEDGSEQYQVHNYGHKYMCSNAQNHNQMPKH